MTEATQIASVDVLAAPAVAENEIEALKKTYAEDGLVIIRGVVSPERLSALHRAIIGEFESAKAGGKLFNCGGLFTGHLNCFPGEESRFVYQTLQERGVIGMNLNLPGSIAQHYHCDRPFVQEFIICNIAVVDTVIENGAIDLLPGTQKKFYPFWRFAMERIPKLTRRIEMKQGDILLRSSNLWHRGMPNLSKAPRPMMALTWEDGGSVLDDPFSQQEKGKITFRANWFKPNALGRLRERTFAAAPITYDAFRFVRSFFGRKGYDN